MEMDNVHDVILEVIYSFSGLDIVSSKAYAVSVWSLVPKGSPSNLLIMKSPAGLLASSFLQAFNASIVLAIRNINGNDFFIIAGFYCLRSEEHTSELQSLMRISYAVFCLKKKIHHIYKQNVNNNKR